MKKVNELKTDQDVRSMVEEIIGEDKECEKNLLTSVLLFLLRDCPKEEHDFYHALQLVLATRKQRGQRNPMSDLDKIFEQVEVVEPKTTALNYYKAYKCYPDGMQGQAAGNIAYKIAPFVDEELKEYEKERKELKYSAEDVEKIVKEQMSIEREMKKSIDNWMESHFTKKDANTDTFDF